MGKASLHLEPGLSPSLCLEALVLRGMQRQHLSSSCPLEHLSLGAEAALRVGSGAGDQSSSRTRLMSKLLDLQMEIYIHNVILDQLNCRLRWNHSDKQLTLWRVTEETRGP